MTNNSSKFFRKILKNSFLVTASGAAIMLSSSGALGAALDVTADVAALQVGDATSLSAAWANGDSLKLTGGFNITTGEDNLNVAGVNVNGNLAQTFTVGHNNTTIGGALAMNLTITAGSASTAAITKSVNFTGNGQLTVNRGMVGAITTAVNNTGKLIITVGNVGGAIGTNAGNILNSVTFNGASNVKTIDATTVSIGGAGVVATTGAVTADVNFTGNGQLTVGAGDITGAVTTAANNTGKLIVTAGNVGGAIGTNAGNILNSVTFNSGAGPVTAQDIFATTVTIGKDAGNVASVVKAGAITGAVEFSNAGGQLTVDGGITAAVTTLGDAATGGTLIVTSGDLGSTVGANGNALTALTFNNVNAVSNVAGEIFATKVNIGEDAGNVASVVSTKKITGAAEFGAAGGQLTVDGGITAAVTTLGNAATGGTLIVTSGDLGSTVGANGNALTALTFNGASTLNGAIDAQTITINGAVTANVGAITGNVNITSGTLTTNQVITGDLDVSGGGNLAGDAAVTDVTGTVTLQATAGNVAIKDATKAASAVSIAGGTLNIHNAAGGINFTGNADATVNVAVGGNVGAVNNTTLGEGIGILNFTAAGQAGAVGATKSLKEVRFSGAAVVTLGAVKATNINFAAAAVVNATGNVTANIDFKNNDGVIILDNGVNITGTVGSTLGTNGTLSFLGSSTVTETIGGAAGIAKLALIQAKGNGGNIVNFNKDVFVTDLKFTPVVIGPASTIKIGGNLTGNITFFVGDNNGGTLEFNGNAVVGGVPVQYTFDGAIAANADKGTLNVNTSSLTALNATVATLKTINIVDAKTLILDASAGDVTVLDASTIVFAGANSTLGFSNANDIAGKNIKLANNIAAVGGGGNLQFIGGATKALTVTTTVGNKTLGAAANKLTSLIVKNNITIANTIDASNIPLLNVVKGATLLDQSMTTAAIQTINIGADGGAGAGSATHTIDVSTAAVPVALGGGNVKFADAGSTFKLQNTVAGNKTVTLTNNIVGGVGGAGNGGIVELNAADVGGTLTINGGKTLGTDAKKLQTLKLSGNGTIDLTGADYFATNLDLSIKAVTLANITQPLAFSGNTILTATGNITSVDFKGFNATINMANGTKITGTVTNTVTPPTNNGTINFAGTGQIGGNISDLAMLKAGAGAVTLSAGGATKITEIQGTGTDTLTLGPDFKLTGAINLTGGQALKLNFTNGGSVSGVVGTAANSVGGITTAGTTTFTSAVNSKGPIIASGNTTFSNSLNNIGDVTTTGTTIFTGAYTNAGTAIFGGTTNFASTFNNTGAVTTSGTTTYTGAYTNAGNATFGGITNFVSTFDNTGVVATTGTTTYTGAYTNAGNATFGGTTSFADTFNNTGAVTLAPASINNFAKNVTATSFVANNATMNFGNSLAFNSGLTGSGTTINLGSGQLAYTAQGSFTDTLTLNSNFNGATNSGGNILITGANSKMDLSGVTKLKLVISTTNFDVNNVNPNTKYTLILAQDGGSLTELSSADVIETAIDEKENRFLKWTLNPSSLVLTASNISDDSLQEALDKGSLKDAPADVKESIRILIRAPKGSEADKFETNLGFIKDNEVLVDNVIGSLQPDTVRTGDAVTAINTQATSGAITSAITSLSSRMNNLQVANNQNAAVAAGEEDEAKFGIWATPFVGNSTQKMRNNVNGNKSNFNGATVGFDGMLNDNLVLGVAYTRADSKIKQKNDKIGDSSKVDSNIYSIYGLYNLPTNNLFFEAVGSYGDSRVKNRTQHLLPTARNTITSQIAHGKYKSRSYTGQVMVGYDYVTAQANLTPMAGIRYSNIKDAGYTETGTTLQNLIVKGKKYNIVEGLAGAKVSTNVNVDQVILTPELYGLINYGFKNKAPAIDARLQGMDAPFPTNSFKSPKVSYNLGAGVTAKYQMMEYGINYDVNIASKYFAQQGSLKVRVNF